MVREKAPFFYVWSAAFLFSYFPILFFYCEHPAERFHLAEYGLLVIFAYWTLKVRIRRAWIYLVILCYTFLVGLLDEIIQYILPNRVYDFKDVIINWASSFLATGLVFGVTWKSHTKEPAILRFRK